eukprot:CAMPEP_0174249924 /NCGR_PEP_ID=MMETSP0439-20130205/250_1 /TAXON_ID=0 /ORGANISM="Stereomyxa ramosa, Strain Chinc5" /LENGTH=265 /DNA_ID=CAMNT_0015329869 /DNA_START=126 /DNA_END=922 /DNA_ORIENTATION=+
MDEFEESVPWSFNQMEDSEDSDGMDLMIEALVYAEARARIADTVIDEYDKNVQTALTESLNWLNQVKKDLKDAEEEKTALELQIIAQQQASPPVQVSESVQLLTRKLQGVESHVAKLEREYEKRCSIVYQIRNFLAPLLSWRRETLSPQAFLTETFESLEQTLAEVRPSEGMVEEREGEVDGRDLLITELRIQLRQAQDRAKCAEVRNKQLERDLEKAIEVLEQERVARKALTEKLKKDETKHKQKDVAKRNKGGYELHATERYL